MSRDHLDADEADVHGLGDLIESGYDDQNRSRRSRHRSRRRSPLGVLLALIVVAALVAGIFFVVKNLLTGIGDVPDYAGEGTSAVQVRVNTGDSLSTVANTLENAGVVKSARAFIDAAEANADSSGIQPGLYELKKQMKASSALELLLDKTSRLINKVSIPEGYTVAQTLAAIAKGTKIPLAELKSAVKDAADLGLPTWASVAKGNAEGFLAPGTYEFDPSTTAIRALQSMVERFIVVAGDVGLESGAKKVRQTPYDILKIASLIEREAKVDEDRPKIARVIYNRLAAGTPLGVDAALAFGLNKSGNEITKSELESDNPFNLRRVPGLMPTPIAAPGQASLEAALNPTPGPWIYYVLIDAEGHHFFTDSAAEFEQKKAECKAKGLGCG